MFSDPIPSWAYSRGVPFLYFGGWWRGWGFYILACSVGAAAAGIFMLLMRGQLALLKKPVQKLVEMRLWCAQALFVWSVTLMPALCGVYYSGANLVECGKPWLRITAAYLHGNPTAELAGAFIACVSFGLAAWSIRLLGAKTRHYHPVEEYHPEVGVWRSIILWVVWILVTLLLSVPTALYILSNSLPPDENVLHLGSAALLFFEKGAAPILYTISAWLVPPLARLIAKRVTGVPSVYYTQTAAHMMIFARLFVAILIPFATSLALNQQCFGLWLQLWGPCRDADTFDITVMTFGIVTRVTQHDDVCWPGYSSQCPRALVDSLGVLLLQKLLFTAFVGPVLVVLLNFRTVRKCKECLFRKEATTDQDTEVVGIVMVLEIVLVFGFVMPCVLPVAALAFALHACAFEFGLKHQGVVLKEEVAPPVTYLWFSMALGAGLVAWMYAAFDWTGQNLVLIGVPTACTAGAATPELKTRLCVWWRQRQLSGDGLAEFEGVMNGSEDGDMQQTSISTQATQPLNSEPPSIAAIT